MESNQFVVSPRPSVSSRLLDLKSMACVVVGSDGLWDMIDPQVAVDVVHGLSVHREKVKAEISKRISLNVTNPGA